MRGSKKFRAPKTPLELEAASDTIAPDDQWLDSQVLQMARQLARKGGEADKVAAGMIISQVKQKQFSSTAGKVFLHGFHQFLLGRLPDELARQSLFGTEPLYDDPEVRAYLEAFIKAKQRFRINLAQMDLRTPKGINQWFLYYKYRILKRDSSEFLADWSVFETAFNDHPDQKFFDPLHPWMPRPYGISSTTDGRAALDDDYDDDEAQHAPAFGIFRGNNNGNNQPPARAPKPPKPDINQLLADQQRQHLEQMQAQHAAHLASLQRFAPDQTALNAHAVALDRHSQQLAAVQAPDTAALTAHTAALNAHRDALERHAQQLAATPPAPQLVMQPANPPPPPPPAVVQQTSGSNNNPPPPPPPAAQLVMQPGRFDSPPPPLPSFSPGTFNLPPQSRPPPPADKPPPPLPPQPLPPPPQYPADNPPSNQPPPPPPPPTPPVVARPPTEPIDIYRDPEPIAPPRPTSPPPPIVVGPPRPIDHMNVDDDETRKREEEPIAVQDRGKRLRPMSDEEHEAEKLKMAADAEAERQRHETERQKLAADAETQRQLLENLRVQHEQELERERQEHEAERQRLAAEADQRERQLLQNQRVQREQELARERQRQQQRMQEHETERQRLAAENEKQRREQEMIAEKRRKQLIAGVQEQQQPSTTPPPRVRLPPRAPSTVGAVADAEMSTKPPSRSKKPAAAAEVMPAAEQPAPNLALRPRRQSTKAEASASDDEKAAARLLQERENERLRLAAENETQQREIAAEKLQTQLIANVQEEEQPSTKPLRPRRALQRQSLPAAKESEAEVDTKLTRSKKPVAPASDNEKAAARKIREGATDTTAPAKKANQRTIRPPAATLAKKTKAVTTPITTEEVTSLARREMQAASERAAAEAAAQQQAKPVAAINRALNRATLHPDDKAAIHAHLMTKVHATPAAAANAATEAVRKVKEAAHLPPHTETEARSTAISRVISPTRHKRAQSK